MVIIKKCPKTSNDYGIIEKCRPFESNTLKCISKRVHVF